MTEWQPIATAPKDGTRILITDGTFFAAGYRESYTEPDTIGDNERWNRDYEEWKRRNHVPDIRYSSGLLTRKKENAEPLPERHTIKNPKAGERREWWQWDNPSAFRGEDACGPDYDGNFEYGDPTHWMPLLKPPY